MFIMINTRKKEFRSETDLFSLIVLKVLVHGHLCQDETEHLGRWKLLISLHQGKETGEVKHPVTGHIDGPSNTQRHIPVSFHQPDSTFHVLSPLKAVTLK